MVLVSLFFTLVYVKALLEKIYTVKGGWTVKSMMTALRDLYWSRNRVAADWPKSAIELEERAADWERRKEELEPRWQMGRSDYTK